jgi:UDP-N-acetylmuramate-alanine ligase
VVKRAELLGAMMENRIGIAVAGTHGKTTTTAMIAWVLTALGKDPTFIIGGVSANLGVNARAGKGPYFVIEADEYDRMFHGLKPAVSVITNIEHDHPDCFSTIAISSRRLWFLPTGLILMEGCSAALMILGLPAWRWNYYPDRFHLRCLCMAWPEV